MGVSYINDFNYNFYNVLTNTATTWKRKVRKKESTNEITPFDNAVKKEDAKIFNPESRNPKEYKRSPAVVSCNSSRSSGTKMCANGLANTTHNNVIATPAIERLIALFLRIFFNSAWFSAPK